MTNVSPELIELSNIGAFKTYTIIAEGYFSSNGEDLDIKFKEVMLYGNEKLYTFAYSNGVEEFDSQLLRFEETIYSFELLSKDSSMIESVEQPVDEGWGCLIVFGTPP